MLSQDQAKILLDHVVESLSQADDGEILRSEVMPARIHEVADAFASLSAIASGDDQRDALIRLLRDLPSLDAELNPRVAEMLAALGEPSDSDPGVRRVGRVEIHVAGSVWIPSEVVNALGRIAEATYPGQLLDGVTIGCTPRGIAYNVEQAMARYKARSAVQIEVRKLVELLDPDREIGEPTVHEVQLATETVQRLLAERPGQWVERTEGGVTELVRMPGDAPPSPSYSEALRIGGGLARELSLSYKAGPTDRDDADREDLLAENRKLRARLDELSGWPSLESYPRKFGCWWVESDPEVTEVVSRSPRDAAISFFLRKVSENHVHTNPPDYDRIGVVEFETGDSQIIGVRITVDTDVEGEAE